MKTPFAFLFLLAQSVAGQEETCSADGTCESSEEEHDDDFDLCFPDGECFEALDEAVWHYRQFTEAIELILPKNYGEAQLVDSTDPYVYEKTLKTLASTHEYMKELFQNDTAKDYRDQCKMNNSACTFWASVGECDVVSSLNIDCIVFWFAFVIFSSLTDAFACLFVYSIPLLQNPRYMTLQCAPACQTCDQISFEHRCPFDRDAPKAWGPGDLNKMFERLTQDPYYVEKFSPEIHSKPPEGPWVITLDNVTTEEQCSKLIQLGADRGYTRSKDVGEVKFDGSFGSKVHETRTSHNTWCLDECYQDEATQAVLTSMENITGIPDHNSEFLQLLRYEETQRYAVSRMSFRIVIVDDDIMMMHWH